MANHSGAQSCYIIKISILCLILYCLNASATTIKNESSNKIVKLKDPKMTSNNNEQSSPDDILKDTFGLLDMLDQKVSSIGNRTSSAMMKDNLRSLEMAPNENDTNEEEMLAKLASDVNIDRRIDHMDPIVSAASDETLKVQPMAASVDSLPKRAKQLSTEDSHLETDSTDRHIKFTLDLMKSIFLSQGYKAETNSIDSFLISPLSIQTILMMMHLGAKGQTRRDISNCLHLGLSGDKDKGLVELLASTGNQNQHQNHQDPNSNKLKRRHQQQTSGNQHQERNKRSQSQPLTGAHELFSSSVRNLLKDPIVMKALTSANQVLVQKTLPLSSQFEWAIKHYYGGDIKHVNFLNQNHDQSHNSSNSDQDIQQMVNDWVERQSKGRIVNLLSSPVSASTLLMAINVLFFKGDWQYKFDPADTETDSWFTQANGKTVKVPMMVNKLPLAFAHDPAMRTSVIELPYKAQRLGLFLLLPDEVAGIFHTMKMLNSTSFANLISTMRRPSQSSDLASNGINVRIPKFSIESSPKLSQILSQHLGLKSLFMPDVADLSGMFSPINSKRNSMSSLAGSKPSNETHNNIQVGLDELLHKAVLQVDEQGSVAAASSAAIVERVGLFNSNYFEADHPFLLFLMDKQTGLILFSGAFAGDNGTNGSASTIQSAGTSPSNNQHNSTQTNSNSTSNLAITSGNGNNLLTNNHSNVSDAQLQRRPKHH